MFDKNGVILNSGFIFIVENYKKIQLWTFQFYRISSWIKLELLKITEFEKDVQPKNENQFLRGPDTCWPI